MINKIRNLKIYKKILLSLGCLFALLVLVAVVAYVGSVRIEGYRLTALASEKKLDALTNLRALVRNRILETYDFIFVINELHRIEKLRKAEADINSALLVIKSLFVTPEEEASLAPLKAAYVAIDKDLDGLITMFRSGEVEIGKSVLMDIRERRFNVEFIGALSELIAVAKKKEGENREELKASTELNNRLVIAISLFGILSTLLLAYLLGNSIRVKLEYLQDGALKISEGNLDVNLPITDKDELSQLASSFNGMARSLLVAKDQLSSQQAMLTANSKMSALGEMAGGVAHEINTPLATIQLLAAQLSDCVKDNNFDTEIFSESLTAIDSTVKRIAQIVSGLRSFSRDSRKDPVITYSLSKIVEETFALCRDRFKGHSVELEFQNQGEFLISCRPSEISQVILNMLNNSFDAIEHLDEKWIRVTIEEQNKFLNLTITDSGSGIPAEIQEKLMQPFFTTKEIGKGTGLGLSISKGLIEGHGGSISIDQANAHTSFVIALPKEG